MGISASGAADALSLRAGNLLVGNPENAPALEMTLAGGTFEFEEPAMVALTGADFETSIPMWQAVQLKPGDHLRCGQANSGARCYLCIQGGIDVPRILGGASTHLLTGLGGFQGRALKREDILKLGEPRERSKRAALGQPTSHQPPTTNHGERSEPLIRVTAPVSPQPLCAATWEVRSDSDRMGLRLQGPPLDRHTGHMLTEGVPLGAIQVPPDGQPIILFVEHQTTGGYPKIANVISADFHALGQLRPRSQVRFEEVTMDTAHTLLMAQEEWLHSLA